MILTFGAVDHEVGEREMKIMIFLNNSSPEMITIGNI